MLKNVAGVLGIFLLLMAFSENSWCEEKVLKMSTTTSTQSSGLLDILLPAFEHDTTVRVKVIAKGTGAAIRDGMDGNVDVIFVHAKGRETEFVEQGYGTKRYAVMHNDFVILGPAVDPAGISGKSAAVALAGVAESKALFVSRGDDSGTHTREQALWAASGVQLEEVSQTIVKKGKKREVSFVRPVGSRDWYLSIGQGMGKVLTYADEKQAYTLADRGTYIKYKFGRSMAIDLEVLSEGGAELANPYGIIPVNPEKYPAVQYKLAMKFVDWITGARGQKLIADYRLEGTQLFYPDAQ